MLDVQIHKALFSEALCVTALLQGEGGLQFLRHHPPKRRTDALSLKAMGDLLAANHQVVVLLSDQVELVLGVLEEALSRELGSLHAIKDRQTAAY